MLEHPLRYVMLAEDNAINRKLGVKLLEKFGCRVDVVTESGLRPELRRAVLAEARPL